MAALSVDDLAAALGVGQRMVRRYLARGMPRDGGIAAAKAWASANVRSQHRPLTQQPTTRHDVQHALLAARTREAEQRARKHEAEAAALEGRSLDIVALAAAVTFWRQHIHAAVSGCGEKLEGELLAHFPRELHEGLRPRLVDHERALTYAIMRTLLQGLRLHAPALAEIVEPRGGDRNIYPEAR